MTVLYSLGLGTRADRGVSLSLADGKQQAAAPYLAPVPGWGDGSILVALEGGVGCVCPGVWTLLEVQQLPLSAPSTPIASIGKGGVAQSGPAAGSAGSPAVVAAGSVSGAGCGLAVRAPLRPLVPPQARVRPGRQPCGARSGSSCCGDRCRPCSGRVGAWQEEEETKT